MQTEYSLDYLMHKYIDMVYRIAFNWLKNAADSDDVTQNVMLKLCRADKDFESEAHIKNWLIHVTINECKKLSVSVWRKRMVSIDEYANTLSFETSEQSELFYAVMELPKKYRMVVYLYYYEDYSVTEISSSLGVKESTVQTQLMRARQKLKSKLLEGWSND